MANLADHFHRFFGLEAFPSPTLPEDAELVRRRMRFIREEFKELMDELELLANQTTTQADFLSRIETLRRILKEASDLRYVVDGTATALGLDIEAGYEAVHKSNMTKVDDAGNPIIVNGKVMKGPNYQPPDMECLVVLVEGEVA